MLSLLLVGSLLASYTAGLDTDSELITQLADEDFNALSTYNGNVVTNINNDDPYSYYASEENIQYSWVYVALHQYIKVEGILIVTNQDEMTSGTFNVYVYTGDSNIFIDTSRGQAARCETLNNVGVNAQGGVFNCGKSGDQLLIICNDYCYPRLAISTVRIWAYDALSSEGTFYVPNTLAKTPITSDHTEADFDTLIKYGGLWGSKGDNDHSLKLTDSGSQVFYMTMAVSLPEPSLVKQVYLQAENSNRYFAYVTEEDTLGQQSQFQGVTDTRCGANEFNIDGSLIQECDLVGQHFTLIRDGNKNNIYIDTIVVTGLKCNEVPLVLTQYDYTGTCVELTSSEDVFVLTAPEIDEGCVGDYPGFWPDYESGYEITFHWSDNNSVEADIAQVQASGEIRIQAPSYYFSSVYPDQPVSVSITPKASPNYNSSERFIWMDTITVYFNDQYDLIGSVCGQTDLDVESNSSGVVISDEQICASGSLLAPSPLGVYEATVGDDEPVVFTFPEVQDSGSLDLGDATGVQTCGERIFEVSNEGSFLTMQGSDLFLQTQDPQEIGTLVAYVEVSLADYPEVAPITVEVTVFIERCQVLSLVETTGTTVSPINQVLELPVTFEFPMPVYEPEPLCSYSAYDVTYKLATKTNGKLPDWISISAGQHMIKVEVEEDIGSEVYGKSFDFKLTATFTNLFQEIQNFKITFIEPDEEVDAEDDQQVLEEQTETAIKPNVSNEEEEPDDETAELEEEILTIDDDAGWDGWKILLDRFDLDFDLPKPRTDDPNYVPTPPKASIGTITDAGLVNINFSEPVFRLEGATKRSTSGRHRRMRDLQTAQKFINVDVIPGENSDPAMLGFTLVETWKDDDKGIDIQIKWTTPPAISSNIPEDKLVISFNGPFFDQEDGLPISMGDRVIQKEIPPQIIPGALTDSVAAAGDSLQAGSTGFLAGNAAMNIFLQGSLNQVWGMINNLQIIIHAPLIEVPFPGNAFMLYEVMISVATFDILPTDAFYPDMFPNLSEEEPFSDKFERLGYETQYIIMNMGTMFLVFSFNMILLAIYYPAKLLGLSYLRCRRLSRKIGKVMFFRWQLIFVQEAYLDLFISACINFQKLEGTWTSFDNLFNNMVAIVILAQLLVLPLLILLYLCPNYMKLKKPRFMDRFGAIYDMIDLKHEQASALLWCIFFLGRRMIFAVGVIFLQEYPFFQIVLFIIPTLAVLIMVGLARPLSTPFENKQELYNNFSILVVSYCLLCFTNFVPDPTTRYNIGYIMILLTIQNIVVGLSFIAVDPFKQLKLRLKRYTLLRAHRKQNGIVTPGILQRLRTKEFYTSKFQSLKKSIFIDNSDDDEDEQNSPSLAPAKASLQRKPVELSVIKECEEADDLEVLPKKPIDAILDLEDMKMRERRAIKQVQEAMALYPGSKSDQRQYLESFNQAPKVAVESNQLIKEEDDDIKSQEDIKSDARLKSRLDNDILFKKTLERLKSKANDVYNFSSSSSDQSSSGSSGSSSKLDESETKIPLMKVRSLDQDSSLLLDQTPSPFATPAEKQIRDTRIPVQKRRINSESSSSSSSKCAQSGQPSSSEVDVTQSRLQQTSSQPASTVITTSNLTMKTMIANPVQVMQMTLEERLRLRGVPPLRPPQPLESKHQLQNQKQKQATVPPKDFYKDFLTTAKLAKAKAEAKAEKKKAKNERKVERRQARAEAKTRQELFKTPNPLEEQKMIDIGSKVKMCDKTSVGRRAATILLNQTSVDMIMTQRQEDAPPRHVIRNNFNVTQRSQFAKSPPRDLQSSDEDAYDGESWKHLPKRDRKIKLEAQRREGHHHKRNGSSQKRHTKTQFEFRGGKMPLPNSNFSQGGQMNQTLRLVQRGGNGENLTVEGAASQRERKRFEVFHSESSDEEQQMARADVAIRQEKETQGNTDFLAAVSRIKRILDKGNE